MEIHNRNLLNESDADPITTLFCKPYCDVQNNPLGHCPTYCFDQCYSCCKILILESPPPPPPSSTYDLSGHYQRDKHHGLSLLLIVSLAVLATAFFLFSCYTIYKLYWNWSRIRPSGPRRPEDEESGLDDFLDLDQGPVVDHPIWYIRTVGLDPSVINSISIVKYKKDGGIIEGSDCCVCLSEFQEDEALRLLPKCNHTFHLPCIDTWLRSHTNCPVCRAGIANNSAVSTSTQELNVPNSGLVEGTNQDGVSELHSEVEIEAENDDSQLSITIEDESESRARIGLKNSENLSEEEGNLESGGIQPMRRSVSMDFLSASAINKAIANGSTSQSDCICNHLVEMKGSNAGIVSKKAGINQGLVRLVGSPSTLRCLKTGHFSMKRSLSCSAKVFLSRYSGRGRNSVIPC